MNGENNDQFYPIDKITFQMFLNSINLHLNSPYYTRNL